MQGRGTAGGAELEAAGVEADVLVRLISLENFFIHLATCDVAGQPAENLG